MSGFPNYPSRDAFGPTMDLTREINPRRDIGGQRFNLTWWQLAGCGLMVPRAWVLVAANGTRIASAESWNPNQESSLHPTTAKIGTGAYTITFAASAPDEEGVTRLLGLRAVGVFVQSTTLGDHGVGSVSGGNVATIATGSGTTAGDQSFLAVLW